MAQAAEIRDIGEERGQLISREANKAVHAAFKALAQTVLVNSRTLDDLVREMLQPILKVWIDDNLPAWSSASCGSRLSRYRRDGPRRAPRPILLNGQPAPTEWIAT